MTKTMIETRTCPQCKGDGCDYCFKLGWVAFGAPFAVEEEIKQEETNDG